MTTEPAACQISPAASAPCRKLTHIAYAAPSDLRAPKDTILELRPWNSPPTLGRATLGEFTAGGLISRQNTRRSALKTLAARCLLGHFLPRTRRADGRAAHGYAMGQPCNPMVASRKRGNESETAAWSYAVRRHAPASWQNCRGRLGPRPNPWLGRLRGGGRLGPRPNLWLGRLRGGKGHRGVRG